jgi:hypothetical protein
VAEFWSYATELSPARLLRQTSELQLHPAHARVRPPKPKRAVPIAGTRHVGKATLAKEIASVAFAVWLRRTPE